VTNFELKDKNTESQSAVEHFKDQLDTSKVLLKNAERKFKALEKKDFDNFEMYQKQSYDIQEANYERDRAIAREANLQKEIELLSKRLLEQSKVYKEKNELEIQTIKSQFNVERKRFCEETGKLEEMCCDLKSRIDRAIREKRAAESEIDKLTLHIPAEADRMNVLIEELHSKLRASERERHDALQKATSLHEQLIREQNHNDSERHQANERQEEIYKRLKRIENECQEFKVIYPIYQEKRSRLSKKIRNSRT
jgi:chromosome segregation ATPase